ncbi:MAG: hypothetical protein LBB53_05730 [Prevotellaceae bacterium]|jgi:hypothetical protein|nr:hypothetical protein [Prevotellaceae bacterium]
MKKILLASILAIFAFNTKGQGLFDALHYADYGIAGSARYMSMAGSFGALGGEVCAALDNPAALGIFRSSEINISISLTPTISTSMWQNNAAKNQKTYFGLNNLSWVFHIPSNKESGYLSSNLSFGYQKIKDFSRVTALQNNSRLSISISDYITGLTNGLYESALESSNAYNNPEIGWLSILGYNAYLINPVKDENNKHNGKWTSALDNGEKISPSYTSKESGSISEYNFTYSGNINDIVYFGAGISLQSVSYLNISTYGETFENGGGLLLDNTFSTSGTGINLKFGAIVRPTNFLRLGLGIITPSYYTMTDNQQYGTLQSKRFSDNNPPASVPENNKTYYSFQSPLKMQASIGFVFGKISAVNFDYQFSNQNKMRFSGSYPDSYLYDNQYINDFAKSVHTLKAGIEFRLGKAVKLRGGFAYISAPVKEEAQKLLPFNSTRTDTEYFANQNYIYGSAGVGFVLGNNISLDFAYACNTQNQTFTPFAVNTKEIANYKDYQASLKTVKHNFVATFAVRY